MSPSLAAAITREASKQTYYTIRFLVDRPRVEDAYRTYAYFRWLDDLLDAEVPPGSEWGEAERSGRRLILDRQQALLDRCLRGEPPRDADPHEAMLVELLRGGADDSLGAYVRNMMRVMEFDVERRGRLVTQAELDEYTRWLATAVTEAMRHFIGHGAAAPDDEARYLAASGAHVMHMLRDTYADLRAGYINVPREVLASHSIGPDDIHSGAYRAWVEERVKLARTSFDAGRAYFGRVRSRRHRLAGLAYIARFAWLIEIIERDGYRLRPAYDDRKSLATGLRMGALTLWWTAGFGSAEHPSRGIAPARQGRS
jgi:phytoene/squalene synthetase